MAKLKRKQENNKLSKLDVKMKCLFMNEHDTILFSFKYLTNQDNYNLKGFKGSRNFRDDIDVLNAFHDYLNRMSIDGWESLRSKNKFQGGRELLDYSQINFNALDPQNELNLTRDTKVWVIRFGGNKYRLIGYRSKKCKAIFHIFGIDHDFSAYKHG